MSGPVIGDDPFRHYDGAYALGTLDPADRAAFEEHLGGCAACRARVADMQRTADLLRTVPAQEMPEPVTVADDVPDELLPALLRRAGRERRRRRALVATLAGVAAAALAALLVGAAVLILGRNGRPPGGAG